MTTTLGPRPARPAGARAPGATPTAFTTAILLATAPGEDGRPAALLEFEGESLVRRLAEQLRSVGATEVHVVARPGWAEETTRALADAAAVTASEDPSGDLRAVARIAGASGGGVVLAQGDVLTQREALAGLTAAPGGGTAILATVGRFGRPFAPRARSQRGRLVSAASPYHSVFRPTATFLGIVKISAADRDVLATVAERLAGLTAGGLPNDWNDELDRKIGSWRGALARIALRQELEGDGEAADVDGDLDYGPVEIELPLDPKDIVLSQEDEEELRRRTTAAPHDVAALVVTGLVREGRPVGINHLRKLFWARPLTQEQIERAKTDIQEYDEDRVLLDSAVKAADGFFTTFFVSPYSKYIARWAAHRGLTPNQVTTFAVLIGVLAGIAFATGERWGLIAGALLLQASFTFDCVDGQLARYTRQFSKLGAWLDSIFDRTKEYVAFAGLAIGAAATGDPVWALAGAALILQTTRHMADFAFGAARNDIIGRIEQPPLEQPSDRIGGPTPAERMQARLERGIGSAEDLAKQAAVEPPRDIPTSRRILGLWRKLDRWPGLVWIKRMVAFPIGERFAVISVTAALWDARTTFTVLLIWGAVATLYTAAGRILRSVRVLSPIRSATLAVYRDDGPFAQIVGRLGAAVPVPAPLLVLAAAAPLVAAIAIEGDGASDGLAAAVIAWLVVVGALSRGRPDEGGFAWVAPPVLRAAEYTTLLWLGALAGDAEAAAFALLCALAFRHYDLVYRLRHRGVTPPAWVDLAGLGWDGRVLLGYVLLVAGALPAAFFALAAVFAAVFVTDAVAGWVGGVRVQQSSVYEEEEDEGQ